jgi:hypothetical protein
MPTLTGLGLELPILVQVAGALVFGVFGWAAFNRGRKTGLSELK